MRTHGTLTKWNDERGFGFISVAGGKEEIFVHISAFPRDGRRPHLNELISFETETTSDGKRRAMRIMRPGQRTVTPVPMSSSFPISMTLPLRCECGTVTGFVEVKGLAVHGSCYCLDCQAFARHLGRPERMLDAQGGTEVIGTLPGRVHFTSGQERLACITLTPRGPLRWYAECCRMSLGNSSRAPKTPFITLHCRAIVGPPAELDRAFGPASFRFAVEAATTPVAKSRVGFMLALPKILWNILYGRLSGGWRSNPFFRPGTDEPIRAPLPLPKEERYRLRGDSPRN